MPEPRRLSAEMRELLKADEDLPETTVDALHDLDVADGEREEAKKDAAYWKGLYDEVRSLLTTAQATIAQLQEKCEKIPGYKAEREAHRTMLMERDAVIAAMLPLAKYGLMALEYTRNEATDRSLCGECGEFIYHAEEDRLRQMAEECGLCQMTKNFDNGKLFSYTIVWPKQPSSLTDTAQLAADHDARLQAEARADERRKFGKDWLKSKIADALKKAEIASAFEGDGEPLFNFDPQDIALLSDMLAYALSQEMNHELHPNT